LHKQRLTRVESQHLLFLWGSLQIVENPIKMAFLFMYCFQGDEQVLNRMQTRTCFDSKLYIYLKPIYFYRKKNDINIVTLKMYHHTLTLLWILSQVY